MSVESLNCDVEVEVVEEKRLLNFSKLHGCSVSREPDRVVVCQFLEEGHHFGVVPMRRLSLVIDVVRHFVL